jgi:hypothetical protein
MADHNHSPAVSPLIKTPARRKVADLTPHPYQDALFPDWSSEAQIVQLAASIQEQGLQCHDGRHGYRLRTHIEDLPRPDQPRPNAGLEAPLALLARRAGYTVRREYDLPGRPGDLPQPATDRLPKHPAHDIDWLRLIREADRGVLRYAPGKVDIAWLIGQVVLAYRDTTVAIVVESAEKRRELAKRLCKWTPDVSYVGAECAGHVGRVALCSFTGLGFANVAGYQRDVVIVVDAREATSERAQAALADVAARHRLFGMLPHDCRIPPRQEDLIAAAFWLVQVIIPRHGYRVRPIETRWFTVYGGARLALDLPKATGASGNFSRRRSSTGLWGRLWDMPRRTRSTGCFCRGFTASGPNSACGICCSRWSGRRLWRAGG